MPDRVPLPKSEMDAIAPLIAIEREIREGARDLRILGAIQWPDEALARFLADWRAGRPRIPQVTLPPQPGLEACQRCMEGVMARTPRDHPLGDFLWRTAWSYATAARMLSALGTPAFTERSIELYGRPDTKRDTQKWSDLDAAEFLLQKSKDLLASFAVPDVASDIPAETLADRLRQRVDRVFRDDRIEIVVAPGMVAKAAATANRVRLRQGATFSELDGDQLFEHEVMVHAATMLNGQRQPYLDVLGLAPPRTTRTQEGLATYAEIVTGSMDLMRLRRIALRVRAIGMALAGADFVQVFRMFLDEGQSEEESAQSAARVFRGGDPRGTICFTKDGTYVAGLLEVDAFLRVAVRDGRPELIPHLFSGRLTLGDAVVLDPLFRSGVLVPPRYIPTWASDLRRLTASMTYSAFVDLVNLKKVNVDMLVELDRRTIEGSAAYLDR